ncbi:hypothetical protein J4221_06925 [Candidatus Pacearchaeota archaeon]|nr:hypothetical protein [Candidatus Pacearchaeota archaeon]
MKEELFGLTEEEYILLKNLNTPSKIQDFLNNLKINFEEQGDTCMSPRMVLRTKKAHCIEGALVAATALRINSYPPLIVDLEASKHDYDHVVCVFKKNNCWGAITKTNHAVLRYREPVYKNIRELVMSFFHEYFTNHNGKKTLRSYSKPVNLEIFDKYNWIASEENVWFIPDYLTKIKHYSLLNKSQIRVLRKADLIEIKAGTLVEYEE